MYEMEASTMNEPSLSLSRKSENRGWREICRNGSASGTGNWNCPPGSSAWFLRICQNSSHIRREGEIAHAFMYGLPHHAGTLAGVLKPVVSLARRTDTKAEDQDLRNPILFSFSCSTRSKETLWGWCALCLDRNRLRTKTREIYQDHTFITPFSNIVLLVASPVPHNALS